MKTRNSHGLLQLHVGREALAYCQCLYRKNKALFVSVDLIGEKNLVILEYGIKSGDIPLSPWNKLTNEENQVQSFKRACEMIKHEKWWILYTHLCCTNWINPQHFSYILLARHFDLYKRIHVRWSVLASCSYLLTSSNSIWYMYVTVRREHVERPRHGQVDFFNMENHTHRRGHHSAVLSGFRETGPFWRAMRIEVTNLYVPYSVSRRTTDTVPTLYMYHCATETKPPNVARPAGRVNTCKVTCHGECWVTQTYDKNGDCLLIVNFTLN